MIWAFVGQIVLTRSKGSWAQFIFICRNHSARELYSTADLYSAEELYSAADLCSVADLYSAVYLHFAVDCFHLHLFLWTFLTLWSPWWVFGPCFSLGFLPYGLLDIVFAKMGINNGQKKILINANILIDLIYCLFFNTFYTYF